MMLKAWLYVLMQAITWIIIDYEYMFLFKLLGRNFFPKGKHTPSLTLNHSYVSQKQLDSIAAKYP